MNICLLQQSNQRTFCVRHSVERHASACVHGEEKENPRPMLELFVPQIAGLDPHVPNLTLLARFGKRFEHGLSGLLAALFTETLMRRRSPKRRVDRNPRVMLAISISAHV